MDKKLTIIVVLGCLFILVNMGLAGIPLEFIGISEDNSNEPVLLKTDSKLNLNKHEEDTFNLEEISVEQQTLQYKIYTYHANAGRPYSGIIDEKIQFDASSSYFGLNKMVSYEWDFGDGNKGYGKKPTHYYSAPGVYYTILTATFENGITYQDIAPVYINQEGNHLYPNGQCFYFGEKDQEILFDGSQSFSNDPDAEIKEWIWHFGDGTIKSGKQVYHSYSEEKVYLVTLEVQDSKGYKRQDVLHADIGVSYSSIEDFFLTTNNELKTVVDVLFNKIASLILYPLLFVKIYSNYNGYEQDIELSNGYLLPLSVDVDHDGDYDVKVNDIGFFKPVISNSEFNNIPWFAFETTISDIEIISDDIKTEDDFTICLQFSLQIMEDFLDLKEPVVRIGYHSAAGEEKPNKFSATHVFRPYILYRVFGRSSNQIGINEFYYNQAQSDTIITQNIQNKISQIGLPLENNELEKSIKTTDSEKTIPSESDENTQQEQYMPKTLAEDGLDIITENGLRVESSDVNSFSLLVSFSNVLKTTKTTLKITFDSFTSTSLMYRRGETISDVNFNGLDNSSLTLSITRENQQGSATLGILVNPVQSFGFSIDIGKLANGGRHVKFNINNPPENIALFAESQDRTTDSDLVYFYLKHLPTAIDFEWLPRLADGYIELSKEFESDELVVGICDNLYNPYTNLYMSNLPTETSLSWEISSTIPKTVAFSSDTDGLTLNAELKDVTQENQTIEFHAISSEDFDTKLLWSIPDGYFELQRSTKNIDFDFLLLQENLELNINGNYIGGPDDGFKFKFDNFTRSSLEFQSDKSLELTINAENYDTTTTLNTDLKFITGGDVQFEWDESINTNFDCGAKIGLFDFSLSSPNGNIGAAEISLEENCHFALQIDQDTQLQLSGGGGITFSQFIGEIGYWSGNIDTLTLGGDFGLLLQPNNKYYEVESTQSIHLNGFDIQYDGVGEEHDLDFVVDYFRMFSGGTTWFDFSTSTPAFSIDNNNYVDLTNFHLAVGSGSSSVIDFTISDALIDKVGTVYGEWNSDYLYIDAAVDFEWYIVVSTLNFGDWETYGNIEGSASINAKWEAGSGSITFDVGESGFSHELEIIHDDLTLNLGSMDLEPGDITFEWQREDTPTNGYFNILNNGISGELTLCKITHNDDEDPFVLEIGTTTLSSGNLYMQWSRQIDEKFIYIDNGITIDMTLIKISWNDKTVTLEDLILSPGDFKFAWNYVAKEATINNGISGLGPSLNYEDSNGKLSLSLINLQDDYSKTMTLKWFEDGDNNISGIYVDTDGVNLIDWVEFGFIKYGPSGESGRKIAIGGLRADDFTIVKNGYNQLSVSGRIYLANHLTYSKLVSGEWKDLDIQWDIDLDGVGNIEFNVDNAFNLGIEISSMFSGVNINSTFDLPDHLNVSWDVDFDGEGYIALDTDLEEVYELEFKFYKNTAQYEPKWGIYLLCSGFIAENYTVSWDFTPPPGEWILSQSGYLEPGSIEDMHLAWNGNWYDVLNAGSPL